MLEGGLLYIPNGMLYHKKQASPNVCVLLSLLRFDPKLVILLQRVEHPHGLLHYQKIQVSKQVSSLDVDVVVALLRQHGNSTADASTSKGLLYFQKMTTGLIYFPKENS